MTSAPLLFFLALAAPPAGDLSADGAAQPVAAKPPPAVIYLPPPPPYPRSGPIGPSPAGNPGSWISAEDYPSRALRNEEKGVVGFLLTVGADGVPLACKVTETSNSESLDTQTCNLLLARGRFRPARDRSGKAVEGLYRSSVRWSIPQDVLPEAGPAQIVYSYLVNEEGRLQDCTIESFAGPGGFQMPDGPCGAERQFAVPRDKDGKPVRKRVRIHMNIEVEDLPPVQ